MSRDDNTSQAFPAPPPYYVLFGERPSKDGKVGSEASAPTRALYEPPPPLQGNYVMFGEQESSGFRTQDLKQLGVRKLYRGDGTPDSPIPYGEELRRLNKEALREFVGVLRWINDKESSKNPRNTQATAGARSVKAANGESGRDAGQNGTASESPADAEAAKYTCPQVDRIRDIFANITHLINLLRPHQARQALAATLEAQIKDRRRKISQLREQIRTAKEFVASHRAKEAPSSAPAGADMDVDDADVNSAARSSSSDAGGNTALEELVKELDAL